MFAARTSQINVVGGNNTLLYGRVVDVADNGLYIDLLCRDTRPEFIPFDRIFLSKSSTLVTEYRRTAEPWNWKTVSVEVLRREYPGGVWRWWPGKIINRLLSASSFWPMHYSAAIVQGQEDNGATWTDLVPQHRIRFCVPEYWVTEQTKDQRQVPHVTLPVRIPPGSFVKRSMPLPADCRGTSAVQLLRVRNEAKIHRQNVLALLGKSAGQVVCVDIVDGHVQYIVELYDSDTLPQPEDPAQKIVQLMHTALIERLPDILREAAGSVERGMIDGFPALRADVWQEVFAPLDTMTRTMLRAVCSAWDAILDTPALAADIVIEISTAGEHLRRFYYGGYTLTAPIFRCLRPSTKHVILHNRGPKSDISLDDTLAVLNVICYMARAHPGIHLTAFYIVGVKNLYADLGYYLVEPSGPHSCPVHDMNDFDGNGVPQFNSGHLNHFIASCRDLGCDAIHLVRCRMWLHYDMLDIFDKLIQFDFDMPLTRLLLSGDVTSKVWDALEAAMLALSSEEMGAMSDWLAAITTDNNQSFQRMAVCQVLCTMQIADPRPSSHYRGKKWCRDGLQDLRWEKLSRITLRFLLMLPDFLRDYLAKSTVPPDPE